MHTPLLLFPLDPYYRFNSLSADTDGLLQGSPSYVSRSVVYDPDSDPVTRYRTCGLSGKKLNLSNTQICIGEYP